MLTVDFSLGGEEEEEACDFSTASLQPLQKEAVSRVLVQLVEKRTEKLRPHLEAGWARCVTVNRGNLRRTLFSVNT